MAAILGTATKQPNEIITYRFDYVEWLADMGDTGLSVDVTVPAGVTKVSQSLSNGMVNVKISGGTDGETYKITSLLTTTGGHAKEAEFNLKVTEV
jgi:hypothetical protein